MNQNKAIASEEALRTLLGNEPVNQMSESEKIIERVNLSARFLVEPELENELRLQWDCPF